MSTAEQLANDLSDLEDLTAEELLSPDLTDDDLDPKAILCACCSSSCGC